MPSYTPIHFIGEQITVSFDQAPRLSKTPGCPNALSWQDRHYRIVELLNAWDDYRRRGKMADNMRPGHLETASRRGSWGVGRFYFRVRTDTDQIFDLYYDRAPKDADDRSGSWFLYRELNEDDTSIHRSRMAMTMQEVQLFEAHDSYVLCLQFTADSQTLISAGMDNVVKMWSVPDWNHLSTIEAHANSVNGFALTPDESRLVTCSSDQTVKVWSLPDGALLHTLQDRKKVVASCALSDDGNYIAAASYGGRVMVWTVDGEDVVGIKVSKKNITSAAFHPSGDMLACSGLGDEIFLWSLPDGDTLGSLSGQKIAIGSLNFLGDGQTLMSWSYDQTVMFWDMAKKTGVRKISLDPKGSRGFLLSPDQNLAAVLLESRVDVRTVPDWTLLQSLPISTKSVSSAAFSADGRWLAVGGADRKIRIFSRD